MTTTLIFIGQIVFIYMSAGFLLSLILRRNDIADIMWGGGFIAILLAAIHIDTEMSLTEMIVASAVLLWALRLAVHIGLRLIKSGEDERYANWRRNWSLFYVRSYLQVWLLQGLFMILVSLSYVSLFVYGSVDQTVNLLFVLGLLIWILGFFFETVGDYQLKQFIKKKKNGQTKETIMKTGLWSLTRHPNYFGEVTGWWGIAIMSISQIVVFVPHSYLIALVGPITISILILLVSGIPMLEKKWEGNPEWEEYKKNTPAFFPIKSLLEKITKNN